MAKIFITGAKGFLGISLLQVLRGKHKIYGLAREINGALFNNDVQWIQYDLTKPFEYSKLPEDVDVIIHLAQSKQYKNFPNGAKDIFDVNIRGTFELLEYGRKIGVKCFILASSGGVYGYGYERFVETDPVRPPNFYLSSKHAAEILVANYKEFFHTIIFRFFFIYGPGQKGMLIPTLLNKVKKGELILIEGKPGIQINPIFVEDAIRVFEPALQLEGSDLFNVAGDEYVTITDLVRLIEKVVGKKAVLAYHEVNLEGNLVGDNSRMKEVLKVFPQVTLLEGLKRCVERENIGS